VENVGVRIGQQMVADQLVVDDDDYDEFPFSYQLPFSFLSPSYSHWQLQSQSQKTQSRASLLARRFSLALVSISPSPFGCIPDKLFLFSLQFLFLFLSANFLLLRPPLHSALYSHHKATHHATHFHFLHLFSLHLAPPFFAKNESPNPIGNRNLSCKPQQATNALFILCAIGGGPI